MRYKTCGTCNYRYNEAIPALGHDYGEEVVEPTCVDKGYTTHICSRCGTGYNDTFVDALGHAYEPLRIEPTCTEEGYKETRKERNRVWGTSLAREYAEEIEEFLKTHNISKVDLICAGYEALKQTIQK